MRLSFSVTLSSPATRSRAPSLREVKAVEKAAEGRVDETGAVEVEESGGFGLALSSTGARCNMLPLGGGFRLQHL